jgi:hypothetical protein
MTGAHLAEDAFEKRDDPREIMGRLPMSHQAWEKEPERCTRHGKEAKRSQQESC